MATDLIVSAETVITMDSAVPRAEAVAVDTIEAYEARIAALERLVGRQALELEFLKGALRQGRPPRSGPTSVITGPTASPSLRDVG